MVKRLGERIELSTIERGCTCALSGNEICAKYESSSWKRGGTMARERDRWSNALANFC
jgi:hypothetical protein